MTTLDYSVRPMSTEDWDRVAVLIHDSTNSWYRHHGMRPIFPDGPKSTRLFCEVYESLDPGCCLVAEDHRTGRLAGSCFYHPRDTHVSLGIMNVHPDCFGHGVARTLMRQVTDVADQLGVPTRLVSSALNLDSFSLYNRGGFVPEDVFQDMVLDVPPTGIPVGTNSTKQLVVRPANGDDLPAIVSLERELSGLDRSKDYKFFLANKHGIWETLVAHRSDGEMCGVLNSVRHPSSRMVGPGVMRCEVAAIALVAASLERFRGGSALVLAPSTQSPLVESLYGWGARNCELHLSQVRGESKKPDGIVIPTFLPESG